MYSDSLNVANDGLLQLENIFYLNKCLNLIILQFCVLHLRVYFKHYILYKQLESMTTISTCLMPLLVFALLLALPQVDALQRNGNADNKLNVSFEDFIITTILPDGETQRIIKWQKICAKETIVNWGYEYKFLSVVS